MNVYSQKDFSTVLVVEGEKMKLKVRLFNCSNEVLYDINYDKLQYKDIECEVDNNITVAEFLEKLSIYKESGIIQFHLGSDLFNKLLICNRIPVIKTDNKFAFDKKMEDVKLQEFVDNYVQDHLVVFQPQPYGGSDLPGVINFILVIFQSGTVELIKFFVKHMINKIKENYERNKFCAARIEVHYKDKSKQINIDIKENEIVEGKYIEKIKEILDEISDEKIV